MKYALDSDVLIYAASEGHPLGESVRRLLQQAGPETHVGSVLLLTEVLAKPLREGRDTELRLLGDLLAALSLRDITRSTALLATQLAAAYRLRAPDALHLASAVEAGADAFLTNNRKDFRPGEILELGVLYPEDL
ncbi:PIN domain nuclease [Deinococcus aetherius]|uniref:Ribonuclease VapC n=1 Tax=Deinococcus aetherius TaxID=200252 RepID=A0ABM8ACH5_9DEIO|nr:PIN domain-containing protein [Deinococcus aetherius]BDP41464.1 PIN domain nuclease [Deinococcus aetherius]